MTAPNTNAYDGGRRSSRPDHCGRPAVLARSNRTRRAVDADPETTMNEYALVIAIANTTTVLAGGAIALLAYRAFRRTGATALRTVAIGVGVIVGGSILGSSIHLVGDAVGLGIALQSAVTAVGFVILLYSLYAETSDLSVTTELSL
ncbi:hypothetical protein [Natrinema pallidum]|uniref:Uncharacterized protein n=2 Tax=Natrinema pallidum TaxID=69527 RepID=L9YXZ7_9EURY|nr:hypothetical protein [Natrinema pallidum]ELY78984.1 hypothetical protein C487_07150 [Natrinema pallidum DSM 3751]